MNVGTFTALERTLVDEVETYAHGISNWAQL